MKYQGNQMKNEIRKLGLSEKEAGIYLACIEMDSNTIQKLSRNLRLSRPTVYRILDRLEKKELIEKRSEFGRGVILAKSPDELLGLLRTKKRVIEEQEREFLRIISLLKNAYSVSDNSKISIYNSEKEKKLLLDEYSTTHAKIIRIIFFENNANTKKEIDQINKKINKRLGKTDIRIIESEAQKQFNFEFAIITDKIYLFNKKNQIAISNPDIVELAKRIFDVAEKNPN